MRTTFFSPINGIVQKTSLCLFILVSVSFCANAQVTSCTNLIHPVYSSSQIILEENVNYSRRNFINYDVNYLTDSLINKAWSTETSCVNGNGDLYYDVYYPKINYSDANKLPVFIMLHAGGFSDCSNPQSGAQDVCTEFAQRGYVAFNIEYRRGRIEDPQKKFTSASHWLSFYRALQDSKGAIRTIVARENARTEAYRIDTSKIFVGGSSSGAEIALVLAYFTSDMAAKLFTGVKDVLGPVDVDGYAGNSNFTIKGILDMWGGYPVPQAYAADPGSFIKQSPDLPPFIAFHGGMDDEVNINSADMYFSEGSSYASESFCTNNKTFTLPANGKQKPDLKMLGSQGLYDVIKTQLNKKAELYIDCDMKHGLEEGLSDFGIGDTVNNKKVQTYIVQRAATFFQYIMNQGSKDKLASTRFVDCENYRYGCRGDKNACSNTATCPAVISSVSSNNAVVINNPDDKTNIFAVQQSGKTITIQLLNAGAATASIYNMNGVRVLSQKTFDNSVVLNCGSNTAGVYILQVLQQGKVQTQKIILP